MTVPPLKGAFNHNYKSMVDAVKDGAITAEGAGKLFGVTPTHFRRLISRREPVWIVSQVKVGREILYAKDQVEWYAKKYRVDKLRESLRENKLNDKKRKNITDRLDRTKLEYHLAYWELDISRIDSWLERMENDDEFRRSLLSWMLREFGPDIDDDYQSRKIQKITLEQNSLDSDLPQKEITLH